MISLNKNVVGVAFTKLPMPSNFGGKWSSLRWENISIGQCQTWKWNPKFLAQHKDPSCTLALFRIDSPTTWKARMVVGTSVLLLRSPYPSKRGIGTHLGTSARSEGSQWIQGRKATDIVATSYHGLRHGRLWFEHSWGWHQPILGQCDCFKWAIRYPWFETSSSTWTLRGQCTIGDKISYRENGVHICKHHYFQAEINQIFPIPAMVMWLVPALQEPNMQHHFEVVDLVIQLLVPWKTPHCSAWQPATDSGWTSLSWYMADSPEVSISSCWTERGLGMA